MRTITGHFTGEITGEFNGNPFPDWAFPRIPWEKRAVLLPQSADEEWAAVVGAAASTAKMTVTQSAEDAFVGPLDRTVYAVNPQEWGEDPTLQEWADAEMPGATMFSVVTPSPYEAAVMILPELTDDIAVAQTDFRWANDLFGEGEESTIRRYGCFLCSLCIILRKVYNKAVTPDLLDRMLLNSRGAWFADNLLDWEAAVELFPIFDSAVKDNRHYASGELREMLDNGWKVVLRRSDGAHFVYLEWVDAAGGLRIIDTWDGQRKAWTSGQAQGIRAAHVRGT